MSLRLALYGARQLLLFVRDHVIIGPAATNLSGNFFMLEIRKTIAINASRERVFSALTKSDEIPQYFPLNSVESDWQAGAEVLYKGEIDGATFTDFGVIETLVSPSNYTYRYWSDNNGTERTPENHITISYELSTKDGLTMLTVAQSNIRSSELYAQMNDVVWDHLLSALKQHVEIGTYKDQIPSMKQAITLIALVVRDVDEAIDFYTKQLNFDLVEDTYQAEQDKRWVVVCPPGSTGVSLLLAQASTQEQQLFIGNQTGGRVFLFLSTDDFWRDYNDMVAKGINFVREPKEEAYGTVAVFEDLYGNQWDLIERTGG
jgi:catechol 2,3-dioxygenase-like lactoylglutathione lyase family enzyme/uncharacterized protein YndB with AHSA1/START domain